MVGLAAHHSENMQPVITEAQTDTNWPVLAGEESYTGKVLLETTNMSSSGHENFI